VASSRPDPPFLACAACLLQVGFGISTVSCGQLPASFVACWLCPGHLPVARVTCLFMVDIWVNLRTSYLDHKGR
jgi:hypothetical protein